jgi:hypothetical protein
MGNFFKSFGHTMGELFTSKKFLVAAVGTVAAIVSGGVAPGTAIVAGVVAYVTGQGMADWGKSAAGKPAGKP